MKFVRFLTFAIVGSLSYSASAESAVKIVQLQNLPKILAIWQEAAQQYESTHPGVKIQFDYLGRDETRTLGADG